MDIYPGLVVKSKAGRDKDIYFVVLSVTEENFCYVADGKIRKVDTPKKKKLKHIARTEYSLSLIKESLENGKKVTNSMIRNELKSLNLN